MGGQKDSFYGIFSTRLREILQKADLDLGSLQELRLRSGRPVLLQYGGYEYGLLPDGALTREAARGVCISRPELEETLEHISGYSLYAFDEELRRGFLTVPGGHRIGVVGKLVLEDGKVQCIRHISCMNIRLSHQIRGCADEVLGHLVVGGTLCHTLIISPPRCGKTTLLRDLIRQVSDGTRWLAGMTVGVVDERSELAGAYLGEAQNDLGMRTDVLEGAPKAEGMMMLLRSMSPQVIAVDEIGSSADSYALENVFHCGCRLIATAHGTSLEDIRRKPLFHRMAQEQMFERYVVLEGDPAGSVREILDGRGNCLYRRREQTRTGRKKVYTERDHGGGDIQNDVDRDEDCRDALHHGGLCVDRARP